MKQPNDVEVWHIKGLGDLVEWPDGGHDLVRRGSGKKWEVHVRNNSNGYDVREPSDEHARLCRSIVARSKRQTSRKT